MGRLAATRPQTFDHVWLVGCSSRVWGHELFLDVSRRAGDDETIHLVRRASPEALRGVSKIVANGFCFGLVKRSKLLRVRVSLGRDDDVSTNFELGLGLAALRTSLSFLEVGVPIDCCRSLFFALTPPRTTCRTGSFELVCFFLAAPRRCGKICVEVEV